VLGRREHEHQVGEGFRMLIGILIDEEEMLELRADPSGSCVSICLAASMSVCAAPRITPEDGGVAFRAFGQRHGIGQRGMRIVGGPRAQDIVRWARLDSALGNCWVHANAACGSCSAQ